MVYYNKDLFDEARRRRCRRRSTSSPRRWTRSSTKGITPLAMAGAEYPAQQLLYQLALSKADRSWVDDYQLYKDQVDFQADPLTYGADTFADWVEKGYIAKDASGLKAEDMGAALHRRQVPMMVSGSWWYGRFKDGDQGSTGARSCSRATR